MIAAYVCFRLDRRKTILLKSVVSGRLGIALC